MVLSKAANCHQLFSPFTVVVREALQTLPEGFLTDDGRVFNLNRLKARTKVSHVIITEIMYADDLCFKVLEKVRCVNLRRISKMS